MRTSTRLGGFRILKDVVWISLIRPGKGHGFTTAFTSLMAREKINLPFLTCGDQNQASGLNFVVEARDARKTSGLIRKKFGKTNLTATKGAVLSIFPHRSKPEVTGALLHVLGKLGDRPIAFANSPSAVSAILSEDVINEATIALFGPFEFGPYRSPEDWKLAQKGKEKLFKEVVASYREKKPKVYGLQWQDGQALVHVKLDAGQISTMGTALKDFGRFGLVLTFFISRPSKEKNKRNLFFCIPQADKHNYIGVLHRLLPEASTVEESSVASFSMNGPHFGDRYGIISELLKSLDEARIELLGLSCSIHTISGVLPADRLYQAIEIIRKCFEVPSVVKRQTK